MEKELPRSCLRTALIHRGVPGLCPATRSSDTGNARVECGQSGNRAGLRRMSATLSSSASVERPYKRPGPRRCKAGTGARRGRARRRRRGPFRQVFASAREADTRPFPGAWRVVRNPGKTAPGSSPRRVCRPSRFKGAGKRSPGAGPPTPSPGSGQTKASCF